MSEQSTPTKVPTVQGAPTDPNLFKQKVFSMWNAYPGAAMMETLRLLPDGLLLGSGLFSFITQNYAYGVFFLIMLESLFINIGLNKILSFMDMGRTALTKNSKEEACRSGFQSPTVDGVANMFELGGVSGFPSTHAFILSSASSYVLTAMLKLKNELSVLGQEYSIRFYIGTILSVFLFLTVLSYRWYYNCEGLGVLAISTFFGGVIGYALVEQNLAILGKDSINILNIPLFKHRDIDGKPIYICPTSN